MDLVQIGWGDLGGIGLAQDSVKWRDILKEVMSLRVL
jgi:hypothetical protein